MWCMHSQVMKKSSPNIALLQDELPPSNDASQRMTAFFFENKQEGWLESDQNEAKWTDYKWDAESIDAVGGQIFWLASCNGF